MPTECSTGRFEFARVEGRKVEAAFDGGAITSDAGALFLGARDRVIGLIRRLAACFADRRSRELVEHEVETWLASACSAWRWAMKTSTTMTGCATIRRWRCWPASSRRGARTARRWRAKSTLNRLELGCLEPTRYHTIGHDGKAIERLFVSLFLEAQDLAQADHSRSRRHRRSLARASGGPLLPWLL